MSVKRYRWCATVRQFDGFREGGTTCVLGDVVAEVVEDATRQARLLGGGRIKVVNCRTKDVVYVDTVRLRR